MSSYTVEQAVAIFEGLERRGKEWVGPCPLCGGQDRFQVYPSKRDGTAAFNCRQCLGKENDPSGGHFKDLVGILDKAVGKKAFVPHECTRRRQ